ncbi:hypothetical protein [Glutamicibacter sp.]|uniref:hypothetical protein n=1 Tax=Glutamicibacter sp. TaxID=1931995 RepID=UPI002B4A09CB|nr:hypothetical protein [Glutamicibacter sp.]HJX78107.1 hypothetical protein [Glutamicibacter sp.]
MNRRIILATAMLAVIGLSGCTSLEHETTETDADHGIQHEIHASPEQVEITEWNSKIAAEAKKIATDAAAAYARPDLTETAWFKALAPFLSQNARDTFQQTSNLNIASTKVVKVHEPVQGVSPAIATVSVQTNATTLKFLLSRADGQWVVEKITSNS